MTAGPVDAAAVDRTAIAVAACRAIESSRADALIIDPWARALVDASGMGGAFPTSWPDDPAAVSPFDEPLLLGSIYIGMRTRFIDETLLASPRAQTVILGAGLDTRAFRLAWPPGARLYEVDRGETLRFKDAVVGEVSPATRVVVAADLGDDWPPVLQKAGFDAAQPTAWVIEGLLPYLPSASQQGLLDAVAALSAPGSWAVIERAVPIVAGEATDRALLEMSERTGVPMADLLARADPPDPALVLEAAGWSARLTGIADLEARYDRRLRPDDDDAGEPSRGGFVVAERRVAP